MNNILILLSLISGIFFSKAYSFPENIRKGYASCRSCHVNPTGQGVLTKYGKALSESLSTFAYEGQGSSLYLFPEPEFLDIGGDVRTATILYENARGSVSRDFLMQADLELALHVSKQITFVGSGGIYGINERSQTNIKQESRRYYGLLKPTEKFAIRIGKFFPTFGLYLSDHTRSIRSELFGQNKESFNIEFGFFRKKFEGTITGIRLEGNNEIASRWTYFLSNSTTLGTSIYSGTELHGSAHSKIGFKSGAWILHETTFRNGRQASYTELGYEVYKGLLPSFRYDGLFEETAKHKPGIGLKLYPIPHFEIDSLAEFELTEEGGLKSGKFLSILHYYF